MATQGVALSNSNGDVCPVCRGDQLNPQSAIDDSISQQEFQTGGVSHASRLRMETSHRSAEGSALPRLSPILAIAHEISTLRSGTSNRPPAILCRLISERKSSNIWSVDISSTGWLIASRRQTWPQFLPIFTFTLQAFYLTVTVVPSAHAHGPAIGKRPL